MKQMNFSDAEVKTLSVGISRTTMDSNAKINHELKWNSSAPSNPSPKSDGNKQFLSKDLLYLKDAELESQLKLLVGRERQLLHLILKHIQEVDRRKLYAARAFSSLFEYLTKSMGYSFAAAQRRIEAARMMNQVPELALQIQKGNVNLSQIGVISQAVKFKESQTGKKLSAEIKREVIATVAQKTTAQTQVLVAEKLDLPLQQPERKTMQKDQSCVLSITLSPEQQRKLQRCRELLAAKMQQGRKSHTTVNYLEELMDFYLSKKDPCLERRNPCEGSASDAENTTQKPKGRQPSLKKQLFQKWEDCQFNDPLTGRKCDEKFQLEMEHLHPRWAGGKDHIENRTLLCRTHNQWKYRQQAGLH